MQCGRVGDFAGRGDGITVVGAASRRESADDDGVIALHELFGHGISPVEKEQIDLRFDHTNGARFRASVETQPATGAVGTGVVGRVITGAVEFVADGYDGFWTDRQAQLATLAEFPVDLHERHVQRSFFGHGNHPVE